MLPKKQKTERSYFSKALKKGKSVSDEKLSLKFLKIPQKENKFSFIVSKAITKKAVERNLLKRRAYNIIKDNNKKIKKSFIYIFFFKKSTNKLSFKELETEILSLLKKSNSLI